MAKRIILIFKEFPLLVNDENITININTGSTVLQLSETFKSLRNSSQEVEIANPYTANKMAENFAFSWNLDHSFQSPIRANRDIYATVTQNVVEIIVKDDSWIFNAPTGSAISNSKIEYNIPTSQNVTITQYSESASNPCSFFDSELTIVGGVSPYDVYYRNNLVANAQTSPITINTYRSNEFNFEVFDANGDYVGGVTAKDTTPLNIDDVEIQLSEGTTDTNITVAFTPNSTALEPYTYSLDDVTYQADNRYFNLIDGEYTIYIKDALGCLKTIDFVIGEGIVYFSEYKDDKNITHRLEILKEGYIDTPIKIEADYNLSYPEEDNVQDAFKPCGLDINLLSSPELNFYDLYSEEERVFRVIYKRADAILFNGWLSTENLYESYVEDKWFLELNCIDGLGYLKDLSYVENSTGLSFSGKQTGLEIIINCLKRTNLTHNLRTSVNIFYTGLDESLNVLDNYYLNSERFIKDDGETIMDCEEVLKSVLEKFNASICYFEGFWYVFRANELYNSVNISFFEYDMEGVLIQETSKNLTFNIGSQIDGFYPHHVNTNQQKSIKRSLGAYKVNLKWGRVFPFSNNTSLLWTNPTTIDEWTINIPGDLSNRDDRGFLITRPGSGIAKVLTSDLYTVSSSPRIQFNVTFSHVLTDFTSFHYGTGVNIKVIYVKGANTYYLHKDGSWGGDLLIQHTIEAFTNDFTLTVNSETLPEADGDIYIEIYNPGLNNYKSDIYISNITTQVYQGDDVAKGQNYTIEKKSNYTPKTNNDVKKLYNGDVANGKHYATIYENDQVTETTFWHRKGINESKNLLRINVEDRLKMNYQPRQIFQGDFYGYIPFFSTLAINNINGLFFIIDYVYNSKTNITSIKCLELLNEDLNEEDVIYSSTLDYGNVVKPTIKG